MVKKHIMLPAKDVDMSSVKYDHEVISAPHLIGLKLRLFVWMLETPAIGSMILTFLKKRNKAVELVENSVIPEPPMFRPEFPPQDTDVEAGVLLVKEDGKPEDHVKSVLESLPNYDPATYLGSDSIAPFRYWKIRDYAHAYRTMKTTPSKVAEHIISVMEEYDIRKPPMPLLVSFNSEEVRTQAAASTQRFQEGNPLSILDGIFMAIKDDIDCSPHPSKGGTTWFHEVRNVEKDALSVSRLRRCGVIFLGKANMHELGMGTTGNNPNFGTARNPHAPESYTGGSSSGSAAIVASGLCSAALGSDAGGSIRIPASLCGVVGLKATYGRIDMKGAIIDSASVAVIGPIASSVEDVMLVYAAILGSSPADRDSLKPPAPALPNLSSNDSLTALGTLRLGKYTEWFQDVCSTDISDKCNDVLNLASKTYGCKVMDIAIPELQGIRIAHLVSIGSEALHALKSYCRDGDWSKFTYDVRTNLALFRSFTTSDYLNAQCLRRRMMYYHMEIFKKVDVIVTPTTGMTAPKIPSSALKFGETDMQVTGYLMQFILAANLLGLPAITVPVGYDKQGLPIGLQIVGRPWSEATLLRIAFAIEELLAESKKRPSSYYDVLRAT